MALISSGPLLMGVGSSCLLHLHQEALEFGSVSIGIGHGRRKHVCEYTVGLAGILLNPAIAEVEGDADLVRFLTIDHHRPDAVSDHRLRAVSGASAGHLDAIATPASQ